MKLITADIRVQLLKNGAARTDADPMPVVKFFNPTGAATWLITEMMPDEPDILFGLCDLGMGHTELGYVSLSELEGVKRRLGLGILGLGIERDLHFKARYPISVYVKAARVVGRITEDECLLAQAAVRGTEPPLHR